jgi:hypothetical protein
MLGADVMRAEADWPLLPLCEPSCSVNYWQGKYGWPELQPLPAVAEALMNLVLVNNEVIN